MIGFLCNAIFFINEIYRKLFRCSPLNVLEQVEGCVLDCQFVALFFLWLSFFFFFFIEEQILNTFLIFICVSLLAKEDYKYMVFTAMTLFSR